ncbi:MAG: hypothetical protein U0792_24425 [Gemmataceae bacterium]
MRQLRDIELHQLPGGDGRRNRAIGNVINAVFAKAGGVAEAALNLVGEHGRRDEILAAGPDRFADRQHGREVVTGVCRFFAEVGVVEVQIADEQAVHERGPFDAGTAAAEDAGPGVAADSERTLAGDVVRLGGHGPDRGGERVDEPPLGFVNGFLGELLEREAVGVGCEPASERWCGH